MSRLDSTTISAEDAGSDRFDLTPLVRFLAAQHLAAGGTFPPHCYLTSEESVAESAEESVAGGPTR